MNTGVNSSKSAKFRIGDLILDTGKRQVSRAGEVIALPRLSYRLLVALISTAPDVLTHEKLTEYVWNGRSVSADTIMQRIKLLRRALGDDASNPTYIGLVRGQGYRLLVSVDIEQTNEVATPGDTPKQVRSADTAARDTNQKTQPIRLIAITALSIAVLTFAFGWVNRTIDHKSTNPDNPTIHSIAVLPLENHNGSESGILLADGIRDDILLSLARVASPSAVSRIAVEQFKSEKKTSQEIAQRLGVDLVLTGGVQRDGNRVRVDLQLIQVSSNSPLLVHSFNEELSDKDTSSMQIEIADTIAQSIQQMFSNQNSSHDIVSSTKDRYAFEAYVRGIQLLRRRTGAAIEAAIEQFKDAIRRDHKFAPAYIGLADSYQLLPSYAGHSATELLPLALTAARTAIDIDVESGEAYASLAMIYFEASKIRGNVIDLEDPEPLFLRALQLSPDYATGNQWYGEYLSRMGRQEEAITYLERAAEIDPLSPIVNHLLAHALWNQGRSKEAETRFRNAVSIDPGFARGYQGLAALYFADLGRVADAALAAKQAVLLNRAGPTNFALLGNIYIHLGDDAEAERWLAEANRLKPDNLFALHVKTMLHVYRKEYSAAAEEARKGLSISPRNQMLLNVIRDQYLHEGNVEAAIQLYETAFPEFAQTGSPISSESSYQSAVDFARVLQEGKRHAEARALLDKAHVFVESQPAQRLYKTHVLHAAIHSLSGETQLAIQSLRRAVDLGWRRNSFYHFDHDPNFDRIRSDSEFQSIAAEVRTDLAAQLQELRVATKSEVILGRVH